MVTKKVKEMRTDINWGGDYRLLVDRKKGLEHRIARSLNLEDEQVLLFNGSNGALEYLTLALSIKYYCENHKQPLACIDIPNYSDTIKFLESSGYNLIKIPRGQNFEFPTTEYISAMQRKPYLVVITNPNNPIGMTLSKNELYDLIQTVPKEAYIIVDATCIDINNDINVKQLLLDFKDSNVILVSSYSKTHNLSATRIGYVAVSNSKLSQELLIPADDGRVSLESMNALEQCIDNNATPERNRQNIRESLETVKIFGIQHNWFNYSQSSSNFALITIPTQYVNKLAENFIFANSELFGTKIPGMYRINLSDSDRIQKFFHKYNELLEE